MKKGCIQGRFTDFNVWDFLLPDSAMRRFTLCKGRMMGSLLPWRGEDWMMTSGIEQDEYSVEEEDWADICSPPSPYIIFPSKVVWSEAVFLRRQFQGEMAVTDTEEEYGRSKGFLTSYGEPAVGLRFTDASSEGTWVDFHTGEEPSFPIPWYQSSEPTRFVGKLSFT